MQLAAVAVIGAFCALGVRRQVPELALVLGVVTGVLILAGAVDALTRVREFLDRLTDLAGLSPAVLAPLLKTVGIAIVTRVASELCRDAGEGGIAAFAETAGAVAALCAALPLMQTVLDMLSGLLM